MNNIEKNFLHRRDYKTIKKNLNSDEIEFLKDCIKNLYEINERSHEYTSISRFIEEDEYNIMKLKKKDDEERIMLIKSCLEVIYINAKHYDVIKFILELKIYVLHIINSLNTYCLEALDFAIELLSLNNKYFSIIPNKNYNGTIDTNLNNLIIYNKYNNKKIKRETELAVIHLKSYVELLEVKDYSKIRFRYLIHNYLKLYEFNLYKENRDLIKLCNYKQFINNIKNYEPYLPKDFYSIPGSNYKYQNFGRDSPVKGLW